jgi:hypothetical protein
MFRSYLASALLAFGLFGYAQFKGWSVFPSEAQEFRSKRAEAAENRAGSTGSGRSGGGGGFSGK